ncbi:hypothetical protein IAE51_08155 [Lactococcus sp. S64]|uniref:hypothetical protein n=1 Tax=Lactococcus sp. S64 TaxID=2767459 RepID=UPI001908D9F0|nr:hypothetical protein [Lactococcus sp. S64]MBK0083877.1 hypothetical protein [Lactococcus sp. S64]
MNKGTGSEADSSITNNATKGEHFLGSSVNSIIELSILITDEQADSFINPLHLMTSLLITSLNFHQSYFSNFAFKY